MFKHQLLRRTIFLAMPLFFWHAILYAQTTFTWTGATNNNWNLSTNWTKSGSSTSTWPNQNGAQNDQAIINSGTPIVNASFINTSLTAVTIAAPGNLSLSGAFSLTITGNLSGSGTLTQSAGTVNVSGDVTLSTLSISGETFVYNGGGAQSVKATTYSAFTKSGAGTATLAGNVVAAATTVSAGTLDMGSNDFTATTLAGAGAITVGSGNLSLSGNNGHTGTFTPGTGTVTYTGGAQNVRSTTYNNLTFNTAGAKTASAATLTVGGTLTFTNSTLAMGGNALVLQGPVLWTAGSMTSTGTVTYSSASNQDIIPGTAGSLIKSLGGTATLKGNLTSAGIITLNAGTTDLATFNLGGTTLSGAGTLSGGTGTLTLSGSNTLSGTFNANTGTVTYTGGAVSVLGTTYNNLTLAAAGLKTVGAPLTVNGTLTHTNSTLTMGANTLSLSGPVTWVAGVLNSTGNVTYNSASNQDVIPGTSGSFTKDGAGTATFKNTTMVSSGSITITNGILDLVSFGLTGTNLSGAGAFSATTGTLTLSGNNTHNGTFTPGTGTVVYNGGSTQTVRGTTYNNLTFSGAGTKTIGASLTVNATMTTGSNIDQNGVTMNFLGAMTVSAGSITAGGNAVNYNSASAQQVLGGNITTLTKDGPGTATLAGNVICSGGITTTAGTLALSTFNLTGTTLSGAGNLSATTGTLTLSGDNTQGGTFTPGTGTVIYNSGSAQAVRGTTYNNLTFSGTGTKTIGAVLTVNATMTSGSNIDQNGVAMSFLGAMTVLAGTVTTGGNAVTYNSASNQDVLAGSFTTLTKTGAGTATLTGNVVCSGALSTTTAAGTLAMAGFNLSGTDLSGAGILNAGSGTLTLSGNNTHSGTFTPGTSTVIYNSGSTQTVRGTTYNVLTFSGAGSKTIGAALTVNGSFTTGCDISQGGFAMIFNGPVTRTAGSIIAGGNALTYSSASNQDVLYGSITTLTKGGTGTATLTGDVTCSGAITISAGTLDLSSTFNLSGTTLSGAGTLTAGSGTITLTGSNTHSGTFNAGTSTVVYNINAVQSIQGYGATGYYNLTISNANTKTIQNGLVVTNIFLYNGAGTLNTLANNNVTFNHFNQTAGTISFGTGSYSFSGNFHKTGGTFTSGSGTINFSGTGFVRSNAAITFPSGGTTINGNRTVAGAGAVTMTSVAVNGALSNKTNLIVNTSLTGAGTFSNDSTASILDVNFAGAGPSVANFNVNTIGTTVRYISGSAQTTRAVAYYNLSTATGGTKTISVGTTIGNDLALGAPTDCAFNLTIPGAVSGTGSFNITGNSTLIVTGNYAATGGLTIAGTGAFNAGANVTTGAGALSFNTSAVTIASDLTGSGAIGFSSGGSLNITGNYLSTGALTMAGTCTFTVNGNVTHGAGALVFNTSNVTIGGTLFGTGAITFSGATGSLIFNGPGGFTSTVGGFTCPTPGVTYSSTTGSQTVRSTTYTNLTLTGASIKNYGTGAGGIVNGIFNNQAGQTLIFPIAASTLTLNGTVTGTGKILGDPAGTLNVSSPGAVTSSLGTLYFDTTKAMGTINFNRQWNRALQVRIGSSVRLNNYTFLAGFVVGGFEIADNEVFKVESPVVTPASTLAANVGRLRYIMLSPGAKFVFQPSGIIPAGTNLTFPIGPSPTSLVPWDLLMGNANGTLNAAIIGATTITGTSTNFDDQILVGYNLYLSNGTLVGEISGYTSPTQIALKAPGSLINISAGSTFKLIQAYRPLTIIPSVAVSGGSLEISIQNHDGGLLTTGTNVPNLPSNRRSNYIFRIRATGAFPNSAVWTEGLISNDFNATIDDAKYSFFKWSGSFWIKLAANLVGPGGVPSNTQIRRNSVVMPGVQTYILGQTGGVLPDDPTFSWTGAGGNSNWKQLGNWNVFPTGAGSWPDDIGHNVVIDGGGIGNPVIQTGDSISIKHLVHSGKKLTIQSTGILNVLGNYSLNQPTLTGAGTGRLIQAGTAITGTNGSIFLTQLNPGTLLYTTEGGFIGAVRSIASDVALTLQAIGGGGNLNILDSSTYNFIKPTLSAGGGNLTCITTSNVVTGTGFTFALNGRMLYTGANVLQGTVAFVQSSTSLLLVNNAYNSVTNQPYSVSSLVVPSGTGTTDFQDGSKVNYNNYLFDQTIAATSYSILNMMDDRVGASTDIARYVNCPGQTITIRRRYRGRVHVKPAAILGPIWQFTNGSRLTVLFPNASSTTAGIWNNFSTNGVAGQYNVKWGTLPTDRIHYDGYHESTTSYPIPAMELQIGSRFGDLSLINTAAAGRWVLPLGANLTVNGSFNLNNTSGALNNVLVLGTNAANPVASLTLLGPITGLNNLTNSAATVHQANLTIGGTGSVSGDLFESVSQLRNVTLNRPGATLNLTGALTLAVTEKITLSSGTFGHTGTGTITAGSAALSGIEVSGGTFAMSSSSNLSLISTGGLNVTNGTVNLINTGSVSIAGNFNQTGGTFNRPTNGTTIQGNISATGGTTNFSGSMVSLTGANAQALTGSAIGLTFQNVTINKTGGAVTVAGGKVKILGSVEMPVTNTANLVTTVPGNLTLISNVSGTARIGSVLGGNLVGSNFTVQRYVNGGSAGWYFLGTPVTGQSLANWGDNFDITTPIACPGTFTENADRNTVFRFAGDAFPVNGTNAVEVNGWRLPSSCLVNPGDGQRVFLKSNFFASGSTFDNTGGLNSGNTPLNVTFNASGFDNGGWNLVANPFPSNVNWDNGPGWTKTNVLNAIYVFKGATSQYGSYVAGFSTNGVDNIIPSNQAFFVRTTASPTLSVNENAKIATPKNFLRTAAQTLSFKLTLRHNDKSDETIIHFSEGATDTFDSNFDASKLESPGINLSSIVNGAKYSINGIAAIETEKVIPLSIISSETGMFSIDFASTNLESNPLDVFLKDNYLGQMIQITGNQTVSFEVNGDQASQGNDRFELIFVNPDAVVTSGKAIGSQVFSLYPNPSRGGMVTLRSNGTKGKLVVTDVVGRVVKTQMIASEAIESRFDGPATPGVYQVRFEGVNGSSFTTKLIVK